MTQKYLRTAVRPLASRTSRMVIAGSLALLFAVAALAFALANAAGNASEKDAQSATTEGAQLVATLGGRTPTLTSDLLERGLSRMQLHNMDVALRRGRDEGLLTGLLLINADGVVVYAEKDSLVGTTAPSPALTQALDGKVVTENDYNPSDPIEQLHGPSLDSYLPLWNGADTKVFGALELATPLAPVTAQVAGNRLSYYVAVGGGGFVIWLLLLPLFIRFAKALQHNYDPRRRRTLRALKGAIERRQLELHYQPLVDAASGTLRGAEALVRWRRGGKLVPPGEFLPFAEESKLMGMLTDLVLDEALSQIAVWSADGRELPVSVNVSAKDLADGELPNRIASALAKHGVPATLLVVEVTETALVEDLEMASKTLGEIADLGVKLALDDFGIGYSSLNRLNSFPFTELKVDRSLVSSSASSDRALLASIVMLGHSLDMEVVAEGVEDQSTLHAIRQMGCESVQGFYYSPALPRSEFDLWRSVPSFGEGRNDEMACEIDADGYFTKLSTAWERSLGYSRAELLSRPYIDLVHPDDVEATSAAAQALSSGGNDVVIRFENRYKTKDGSWHWLRWRARSASQGIVAVAEDLTAPSNSFKIGSDALRVLEPSNAPSGA